MKQGKTLQELGQELQRQRLNRQDFLADTRSLEMESDSYGSTLQLSLDDKPNHRICSTKMSMSGLVKIPNEE